MNVLVIMTKDGQAKDARENWYRWDTTITIPYAEFPETVEQIPQFWDKLRAKIIERIQLITDSLDNTIAYVFEGDVNVCHTFHRLLRQYHNGEAFSKIEPWHNDLPDGTYKTVVRHQLYLRHLWEKPEITPENMHLFTKDEIINGISNGGVFIPLPYNASETYMQIFSNYMLELHRYMVKLAHSQKQWIAPEVLQDYPELSQENRK